MAPQRKNESRRSGGLRRARNIRTLRRRVLIVCEGEQTEPNYFKAFHTANLDVDVVGGGGTPISVIEVAQRYADKPPNDKLFYEVWCVFDRDETSVPLDPFNQATERAKRNGLYVAYSNPCFELWYLLHFHYVDSQITCRECCDKLSTALGKSKRKSKYEKNSPDMYSFLEDLQVQAIHNAKRLLQEHDPPSPADDNPSTTVHLLVETLNSYRQG